MKRGKTEWEYPMPEEMNSPGAEYTPLPDEFLQGGGKTPVEPEKKRNRRMRRMYGMTAAFVLAGCILFGVTDSGKDIPADDTEIAENTAGQKTDEGTEAGKQIIPARQATPTHQVIPERQTIPARRITPVPQTAYRSIRLRTAPYIF